MSLRIAEASMISFHVKCIKIQVLYFEVASPHRSYRRTQAVGFFLKDRLYLLWTDENRIKARNLKIF